MFLPHFLGHVFFTVFFCFLGYQVVGSILMLTPVLVPHPLHGPLQQKDHARSDPSRCSPLPPLEHLAPSFLLCHQDFLPAAPQ